MGERYRYRRSKLMDINYDDITKNIPEELKRRGKWILWKFKRNPKAKKPAKIPYKEIGGKLIAQNDPKRSYRFGYALALARKHQCGIGLFMGGGIAGIDIDDIDDIDNLPDNIKKLINDFNSYTEISVSGKGLHIIVFSDQTFERKRHGKYELYTERRYFTITGNSINGDTVAKVNLRPFYKEYISDESISTGSNSGAGGWTGTDDEFVRFMGNNKLARYGLIWSGDSYTFENEFNGDNSAMDQALINYLVFYLGPDPERVERVARRSEWYADGAHQDKWERRDYLNRTITRAIRDHRGEYFDPDYGKDTESIDEIAKIPKKFKTENLETIIARIPSQAIRDLVGLYMESAQYPHFIYALGSSLAIMGAIMGSCHRLGDLMPNTMIYIVGESGIGKNHALKFARKMIYKIFTDDEKEVPIFGDMASSEGIEDGVYDAPGNSMTSIQDEAMAKITGKGERVSRIMAKQRELATYEGIYSIRRKSNKKDEIANRVIQDPCLSLLFAFTAESFRQVMSSSTLEEGDISRALFFIGPERCGYRNKRAIEYNTLPKSVIKITKDIIWYLPFRDSETNNKKPHVKYKLTENANTFIDAESDKRDELYMSLNQKPKTKQTMSRRIELILKLALIFATADETNECEYDDYDLKNGLIHYRHVKSARDIRIFLEKETQNFIMDYTSGNTVYEDVQNIVFRQLKKLYENRRKVKNKYKDCKELIEHGILPERELKQFYKIRKIDHELYERVMVGAEKSGMISRAVAKTVTKGPKLIVNSEYNGVIIIVHNPKVFGE